MNVYDTFNTWQQTIKNVEIPRTIERFDAKRGRLSSYQEEPGTLYSMSMDSFENICRKTVLVLRKLDYNRSDQVIVSEVIDKINDQQIDLDPVIVSDVRRRFNDAWNKYKEDFYQYVLPTIEKNDWALFYVKRTPLNDNEPEGPSILIRRIKLSQLFTEPWIPDRFRMTSDRCYEFLQNVQSILDETTGNRSIKYSTSSDYNRLKEKIDKELKLYGWIRDSDAFSVLTNKTLQQIQSNTFLNQQKKDLYRQINEWDKNDVITRRIEASIFRFSIGNYQLNEQKQREAQQTLCDYVSDHVQRIKNAIVEKEKTELMEYFKNAVNDSLTMNDNHDLLYQYELDYANTEFKRKSHEIKDKIKRSRSQIYPFGFELIDSLKHLNKTELHQRLTLLKISSEQQDDEKEDGWVSDEEEKEVEEEQREEEEEDNTQDTVNELISMAIDNDVKVTMGMLLSKLKAVFDDTVNRFGSGLFGGNKWKQSLLDVFDSEDAVISSFYLKALWEAKQSIIDNTRIESIDKEAEWKSLELELQDVFSLLYGIISSEKQACVDGVLDIDEASIKFYSDRSMSVQLPKQWFYQIDIRKNDIKESYKSLDERNKKMLKNESMTERERRFTLIQTKKINTLKEFYKSMKDKADKSIEYEILHRYVVVYALAQHDNS
jgi:hypothetical protein